jgi:hypothetical protein
MDFLSRMRGERPIAKAAPTLTEELARLDALLARQEAAIRAAFDQYVRELKSPAMVKEIADLLDRGDVEGALRVLDTYVSRMASVLPRNFVAAGTAEASALAALLSNMTPKIAVSFNAGDPVAAALMRSATLSFIREFSDRQRAATRFALAESIARGDGSAAAARAFRSSIGLTERQLRSVMRYRALLENMSAQALDVGLRDRRFDPTVRPVGGHRGAADPSPDRPHGRGLYAPETHLQVADHRPDRGRPNHVGGPGRGLQADDGDERHRPCPRR